MPSVGSFDMSTPNGPNPLRVAWSILQARRRRAPAPSGTATIDHRALVPILDRLRQDGVASLAPLRSPLREYRDELAAVDPDTLAPSDALAYWLNLYNAGALDAAVAAVERSEDSVLRLPGAFARTWAIVAGENLSLDDIEHGKIRRFGDPRIHGARVCGSASCPTLRYEPYRGTNVDVQLDHQLRSFLIGGGAVADHAGGVLSLSRVFLWYGGDFTRPDRMPTWLPAPKRRLVRSLRQWLEPDVVAWMDASDPTIVFQPYDWSLACRIGT